MSRERANIRAMAGYQYGEQPTDPNIIKLNTNENPYPPSPRVKVALAAFDADGLRRYPDATAAPFRTLAGRRLGLAPEQVLATNGGDEALRLAITTFVAPGAALAIASPGYSLYETLAQVQDCRVTAVPIGGDWRLPRNFAGQANAAGARLAILANPHAPSGACVDVDTLRGVARAVDGVLLIDEAYVDFVEPTRGHDATRLVDECDNVLLLRTLSKGYALAGLRFGFLLGATGLIEPMATKARDSYNTDALSQALAVAAFADEAWARDNWQRVRAERRRLREALVALGFDVAPSQANFLLAEAPSGDAAALHQALKERGVLVRHFGAATGSANVARPQRPDAGHDARTPRSAAARLPRALRITVGAPAENDALLAALAELLAGRSGCGGGPVPG